MPSNSIAVDARVRRAIAASNDRAAPDDGEHAAAGGHDPAVARVRVPA